MSKLWRCTNEECSEDEHGRAIFDFAGDDGVCPKCGADITKPDGRGVIVPRACIHYVVIDKAGLLVGPHGRRLIACDPTLTKMPRHGTGSTAAVTCPDCIASDVFKQHVKKEIVQDANIIKPSSYKPCGC